MLPTICFVKEIFEIRIHGRGGQGAKTAAQFIAEAALDQGKRIQAFPEYGPERSGAPVVSFVRISDKQIKSYAPVVNPDVVMVIDPTLIGPVDVAEGLAKDGILIVNTSETAEKIKNKTKFNGKVCIVDATKIAMGSVGKNLPNTPMLGALVKITGVVGLESVNNKVKEKFLDKIGEEKTNRTIEGIKKAYDSIQ
ncbi:2-oxoacid:acceptor oxidoreductase family protein [Candidatus Woesearchaeota archaeon]|nr:2-oxoacid:acceptor oxidoreductase family protein [Candidatus Woesearchaeota archaeon]